VCGAEFQVLAMKSSFPGKFFSSKFFQGGRSIPGIRIMPVGEITVVFMRFALQVEFHFAKTSGDGKPSPHAATPLLRPSCWSTPRYVATKLQRLPPLPLHSGAADKFQRLR
jgi:hypothetical protein